jgi:hypothetical protein
MALNIKDPATKKSVHELDALKKPSPPRSAGRRKSAGSNREALQLLIGKTGWRSPTFTVFSRSASRQGWRSGAARHAIVQGSRLGFQSDRLSR